MKQSSWLFFGQVFVKLVSFFYTIFLANALGVSNFGLLSAVLAYLMLASAMADFGFNRFLIREIAKDHLKTAELIFNIGSARLIFSLLIIILLVLVLLLSDRDPNRVLLVVVVLLSLVPQALAQTLEGFFTALKKLQYVAIANTVTSLMIYIFSITLIKSGWSVWGPVTAVIFGQTFIFLLYFFLLKFRFSFKLIVTKKLIFLKEALRGSLPYGLLAVMGLLYFRIDTLFLSYLRGNFETGIYSAGYKFLEAIIFVPNALSTALFPVMSGLHEKVGELRKLYLKSVFLMGAFGVLLLTAYLLILPTVIRLFLPSYIPAIEVVKVLAFSIPFIFIYMPASQTLLSTDKYLKPIMIVSVLNLSFNIIWNILLIPHYGYIAAAWVTVASDVFSFLVLTIFIERIFKDA